jgi:hypothetical protein
VPAVDAADTLRAVTSDGMVHPLTRLVVADRRQQWAIVQGPPAAGEALVMAAYDKARKINLNKGGFARMSWEFPVPKTAGVYRADLTVDARPYWRGFVRINP